MSPEAPATSAKDAEGGPRAPRRTLSRVLIGIGAVVAMVAIFAAWADRQALNGDEWVETSTELIKDEEIRTAVSQFAVNELYREVNVEEELDAALPPRLKELAGPLATGLQTVARNAVIDALGSQKFIDIWKTANALAHSELIDVIEDRGEVVRTTDGNVVLELRPLIVEAANSLGLSQSTIDKLPPDVGTLDVLSSDDVSVAQEIAALIRGLALITSILALALIAAGIYVRHGERWIALLGAGIGLILAGIFVLVVREIAGEELVKALATGDAEGAANHVWAIGSSLLRDIAWSVIWFGVFFVIASWLGAPASSSARARRVLTPLLRDHAVAVYVIVGFVGAVWALTAVDGLRPFLVRAILTAMAIAGIVFLRERAVEENPDAQWSNVLARS